MHSLRNISTKFQFDGQLINADRLNSNLPIPFSSYSASSTALHSLSTVDKMGMQVAAP